MKLSGTTACSTLFCPTRGHVFTIINLKVCSTPSHLTYTEEIMCTVIGLPNSVDIRTVLSAVVPTERRQEVGVGLQVGDLEDVVAARVAGPVRHVLDRFHLGQHLTFYSCRGYSE